MDPIIWIIALVVSFVSGIIGGMVGGSYLILIPALLFLGWDIHQVIGITRITTIAAGLAFINYMKNGKIDLKFSSPFALIVIVGSVIGSIIVIELNEKLLQTIIAIFMIIIALFMLFNNKFGVNPLKIKLKKGRILIAFVLFFILGIYFGFYAAAASIFSIILFTAVLRKDFVESVGNARFIDLCGGTASAAIFASKGLIDYKIAIPIGIIYFIGAWMGAQITIKKGSAWVRYLLIILAITFAIKLLFFY